MNTRHLMVCAAFVFAVGGLACSFAPRELLAAAGVTQDADRLVPAVQVLSAAWLGFALLDWHARGAPFGGIYGRPVALGNFLHFALLAMTLAKTAWAAPAMPLVGGALLVTAFALAFGRVLFGPAPPPA